MNENKKFYVLGFLILLIAYISVIRQANFITLENIKDNRIWVSQFVNSNYLLSVLSFIIIYFFISALSIPGAIILTIFAGFLFGVILGIIYVNISATAAAVVTFLITRYFAGQRLQSKYSGFLKRFNENIENHEYAYLLILRLIPIFPFFLVNILAGLTDVQLSTFFLTTMIGIIPHSFVYVFAGRELMTITSIAQLWSLKTILPFIFLICLILIATFFKNKFDTFHKK